jgi:predicted enzyme related to lactoylglutathione lyase
MLWYNHHMLNLTSIMIGSPQPKVVAEFYEKVLDRKPDWQDEPWYGWQFGNCQLSIGEHSHVKGKSKEPPRIMFNLETEDVKKEFERVKKLGAEVVAEPYELYGMWVSTLADPDGNYFQIVNPWKDPQ